MLRTNRRKTVLTTAALLATTALLTSCSGSGSDSGSEDQKPNGSAASSKDTKGTAEQSGDGTGRDSVEDAEKQAGHQAGGKGVSGTWFGTVSYLAPGKYTVTDLKDQKQAFHTSTSTNIQGTGDICGDTNGQAAQKCTETELQAAAQQGVSAKVEIKDGIAVSIIDDH